MSHVKSSASLRVLLIRKDFKQRDIAALSGMGLRVLLIRKDFKRSSIVKRTHRRLRVLLIRKDFKRSFFFLKNELPFESLVNTEGFQTDGTEI